MAVKFVDLFCGIGSFHYSFKQLGWDCVMACDINRHAKTTYEANYGLEPQGDITEIDPSTVPAHDILCAGFPCQPFSQCGQHKGFDDARGTLFFHIMKFVVHHKPKFVVLENVQGLLKHDKGNTFARIKSDIASANYELVHKVIKCSDYGIPQMRKRLLMIAVRKDLNLSTSALTDFTEYENKELTLSTFLGKNFQKPIAYTIRCGGKDSPIDDRHNWDGYYVDGVEYRLSIKDCLKLQGFDDAFQLCGPVRAQWDQLGNTIPTIFTSIVGRNILKLL